MIVCRLVALQTFQIIISQGRVGWGANLVQTLRIVQIFMDDMSQEI